MNKNKKIEMFISIGSILFAVIALLMGFANSVTGIVTYEGKTEKAGAYKLFDLIFKMQIQNRGIFIFAFAILLIVIISLIVLTILNIKNKISKRNSTIISSIGIGFLVISAIVMFCLLPISGIKGYKPTEGLKIDFTLGVGPICWAVFCLLSCGGLISNIILKNRKNQKSIETIEDDLE